MAATVLDYGQIANLVNPIVKQELGEEANILSENLDNLVDIGTQAENAGKVDRILDALVAKITKTIFDSKSYIRKDIYGFLKDAIEYGILQKIDMDYLLPAEDDIAYQLQEGMSVDWMKIRNLPQPTANYFEEKHPYQIPFTELQKQYKLVFRGADELARFTSMCFTVVENSINFQIEVLQKRLMNATIARYINAGKYVDLIEAYNTEMGLTGADRINVAKAKYSKEWLRFASMTINDYYNSMKNMSKLYNIKGAPTWTDDPNLAVLSKFSDLCSYYLESDTFHNNLVSLGENYRKIAAWQNEPSRDFTKISQIDVTIDGTRCQQSNIVAVLYDKDGMMVALDELRLTSGYNPEGEYYQWFNKYLTMLCTFANKNFIVFVMNDPQ